MKLQTTEKKPIRISPQKSNCSKITKLFFPQEIPARVQTTELVIQWSVIPSWAKANLYPPPPNACFWLTSFRTWISTHDSFWSPQLQRAGCSVASSFYATLTKIIILYGTCLLSLVCLRETLFEKILRTRAQPNLITKLGRWQVNVPLEFGRLCLGQRGAVISQKGSQKRRTLPLNANYRCYRYYQHYFLSPFPKVYGLLNAR